MQTLLGEAQLKWVKEGIVNSKSTWKIFVTSVPLSWPTGWPKPEEKGYDGWSDEGAAKEFYNLLTFIRDHGE